MGWSHDYAIHMWRVMHPDVHETSVWADARITTLLYMPLNQMGSVILVDDLERHVIVAQQMHWSRRGSETTCVLCDGNGTPGATGALDKTEKRHRPSTDEAPQKTRKIALPGRPDAVDAAEHKEGDESNRNKERKERKERKEDDRKSATGPVDLYAGVTPTYQIFSLSGGRLLLRHRVHQPDLRPRIDDKQFAPDHKQTTSVHPRRKCVAGLPAIVSHEQFLANLEAALEDNGRDGRSGRGEFDGDGVKRIGLLTEAMATIARRFPGCALVAAGGILGLCVQPTRDDYAIESGSDMWRRLWLNWISQEPPDVDLWLVCPSLGSEQIAQILDVLARLLDPEWDKDKYRYDPAVDCMSFGRHVKFQLMLRPVPSVADLLRSFALDCSRLAWDGRTLWALPETLRCLATGVNVVTREGLCTTTRSRLLQVARRGFGFWTRDADLFGSADTQTKLVRWCAAMARWTGRAASGLERLDTLSLLHVLDATDTPHRNLPHLEFVGSGRYCARPPMAVPFACAGRFVALGQDVLDFLAVMLHGFEVVRVSECSRTLHRLIGGSGAWGVLVQREFLGRARLPAGPAMRIYRQLAGDVTCELAWHRQPSPSEFYPFWHRGRLLALAYSLPALYEWTPGQWNATAIVVTGSPLSDLGVPHTLVPCGRFRVMLSDCGALAHIVERPGRIVQTSCAYESMDGRWCVGRTGAGPGIHMFGPNGSETECFISVFGTIPCVDENLPDSPLWMVSATQLIRYPYQEYADVDAEFFRVDGIVDEFGEPFKMDIPRFDVVAVVGHTLVARLLAEDAQGWFRLDTRSATKRWRKFDVIGAGAVGTHAIGGERSVTGVLVGNSLVFISNRGPSAAVHKHGDWLPSLVMSHPLPFEAATEAPPVLLVSLPAVASAPPT